MSDQDALCFRCAPGLGFTCPEHMPDVAYCVGCGGYGNVMLVPPLNDIQKARAKRNFEKWQDDIMRGALDMKSHCERAIADNPQVVAQIQAGKGGLSALVGHVMKATKGRANPALVSDNLKMMLGVQ